MHVSCFATPSALRRQCKRPLQAATHIGRFSWETNHHSTRSMRQHKESITVGPMPCSPSQLNAGIPNDGMRTCCPTVTATSTCTGVHSNVRSLTVKFSFAAPQREPLQVESALRRPCRPVCAGACGSMPRAAQAAFNLQWLGAGRCTTCTDCCSYTARHYAVAAAAWCSGSLCRWRRRLVCRMADMCYEQTLMRQIPEVMLPGPYQQACVHVVDERCSKSSLLSILYETCNHASTTKSRAM